MAPTSSPTFQPLYLQIKALLVRGLDTGEWHPGEAIPSEIELARRFGVSQGTVRKAIDALAADNLVVRRQGKGTFVATHTEERNSSFRFLRIRPRESRFVYSNTKIDRNNKCDLCQQGKISGFAHADPGKNIIVNPTLTFGYDESRFDPAQDFGNDGTDIEFGLDLELHRATGRARCRLGWRRQCD